MQCPENPRSLRGVFAVAAVLALAQLAVAGPSADAAGGERARREAAAQEALLLLRKGDEAYHAGNYAKAVEVYSGALSLTPASPVTNELRRTAADRFAQASVERARELARKGDGDQAAAVIERALAPGAAPGHPGALEMRSRLLDPIRTNPALDAAHASKVDETRRLLYTAEGAFDLGDFDKASTTFGEVLRLDPTNAAARRGMERVAAEKNRFAKSAYDQTRAAMLSDVEAAWEQPPGASEDGGAPVLTQADSAAVARASVEEMLDSTMVPVVALSRATVGEATQLLRAAVRSQGKDLNFHLRLGDSQAGSRLIDLQLENIPVRKVLDYVTEMTGCVWQADGFAVEIRPAGADSTTLVSRSYRVPPDFLSSLNTASGVAKEDPFAEQQPERGLLSRRVSAREALERQGITFPAGAGASFSASGTLTVVNTEAAHEMVAGIVQGLSETEPVMVSVRVSMIRAEQSNLKELGFDWLVSPIDLGGNAFGSGGSIGNSGGRTAGDMTSPVRGVQVAGLPLNPSALVTQGLLTNGLRSGSRAIGLLGVESLLNSQAGLQQNQVAPGVFSLTGLFTDGQVQMIMRGLDRKKSIDLMASPATVTRSGQSSTVKVIREFIYPTEYEPPEVPQSFGGGGSPVVTPAHPAAFEMREVGVSLEVLPVADKDRNYVDVSLNPVFADLEGFVNYGSPIQTAVPNLTGGFDTATLTENAILMPVFNVQRANTQITVADGATVAFGSLISKSLRTVEDKVPVLGEMPVVGRLFSSKSEAPTSLAIVFLVRVELLDATGRPFRKR